MIRDSTRPDEKVSDNRDDKVALAQDQDDDSPWSPVAAVLSALPAERAGQALAALAGW